MAVETTRSFEDEATATLVRAACDADTAGIQQAISKGASVNAVGRDNVTPLYLVIECRSPLGLAYLLKLGADPNLRSRFGASPAWFAATLPDEAYLKQLIAAGANPQGSEDDADTSALLGAISAGFQHDYWQNFDVLMKAGVNLNVRYGPQPGVTCAEKAIGLGLFDRALAFVEAGYNVDLGKLREHALMRPVDVGSEQASFKEKLLERLAGKL